MWIIKYPRSLCTCTSPIPYMYCTVPQAQNGAGLTSLSSSHGYILDSSPPEGGIVYDGPRPSEGVLDLDYTTSLTTLSAHWSGFADPHCDISEYYWSVGTCSGCSNVQNYQSVGVATGKWQSSIHHYVPLTSSMFIFVLYHNICKPSRTYYVLSGVLILSGSFGDSTLSLYTTKIEGLF